MDLIRLRNERFKAKSH